MAKMTPTYAKFTNGVPYLRVGTGSKTLLFLLGGPGNTLPVGTAASGFLHGMRGFAEEYTIYLVSRKSGLPEGYTTQNMSDDYAKLIREDLGGFVDVMIGFWFGGLIIQHFAADHAELCGCLVIGGAAQKISEAAKRIDYQYASLVHQGKDREAMAARAEAVFAKGVLKSLLSGVLWVFGRTLLGPVGDTFRKDVLIEAQAELSHDSSASLRRIQVPVLVVCGRDDFAFQLSDVQEMAAMIAQATLIIYERGHSTIFLEKRFVEDVRQFTHRTRSNGG
jgi:pimeloyl-ACP methyl ester carboxylesterase